MKYFILIFAFVVFLNVNADDIDGIPIGVLYDTSASLSIQSYAAQAIKYANNEARDRRISWELEINSITNGHDIVNNICEQMKRGKLAIFSSVNSLSLDTVTALNSLYQIPLITWSNSGKGTEESGIDYDNDDNIDSISHQESLSKKNTENKRNDYLVYLQPDLTPTLISLIKKYNWKKLYYVYNHEDALMRIKAILNNQMLEENTETEIVMRKINDISNFTDMLRTILSIPESQEVTIMVDLDSVKSYNTFLSQIKKLKVTQNKYHYIMTTLDINELEINGFRHDDVKITGFSIVDYENPTVTKLLNRILKGTERSVEIKPIPYEGALLIDGILLLNNRINSKIGQNSRELFGRSGIQLKDKCIYVNDSKGFTCSYQNSIKPWPFGDLVFNELTKSKETFEGLTGPLFFDSNGRRTNYTINIYQLKSDTPLSKIGSYSSEPGKGLKVYKEIQRRNVLNYRRSKYVLISTIDAPFVMKNPNAPAKAVSIDQYEGFCIDLANKLSEIINVTFDFRLVKDGKYGRKNENGEWDGMIGELIRGEADIAIAPLVITSQREKVIEFSKPFMTVGISIMMKKTETELASGFNFLSPVSPKVWISIILMFIAVILVLFFVSRFSPYEWRVQKNEENQVMVNDFTLLNTIWFCIAALFQQRVDIAPHSISGRLIASVWWFFTLILVISYVANLTAFLAVEKRIAPTINNFEELGRQTDIKYGILANGSTQAFFQNSKVPLYKSMWEFMNSHASNVFVKNIEEGVKKVRSSGGKYAFLLESSINEYHNGRSPFDTIKVGPNLDSKGYGIAMPVGSDIKEAVDIAIIKLDEVGYLQELKNKWWLNNGIGESQSMLSYASKGCLQLNNFLAVFYIVVIGLVLALIVAVLEVVYKARSDAKKDKIAFKEALLSRIRLSIRGYQNHSRTNTTDLQ